MRRYECTHRRRCRSEFPGIPQPKGAIGCSASQQTMKQGVGRHEAYRVQTFKLLRCGKITGLSCFVGVPCARTLRKLRFEYCRSIPSDELFHLYSLQLKELAIHYSLTENLCSFAQEKFTPGLEHCRLPCLQTFEYYTCFA